MREPQECDNCLYTPPQEKDRVQSPDAPQSMYAKPEMDKSDGDCAQCHYPPPSDAAPEDDCSQCFYEPKK